MIITALILNRRLSRVV